MYVLRTIVEKMSDIKQIQEELIAAEEEWLMGKKNILLTSFIKCLEMQQRRVMPNKKYTVIVSDRAASMLVNHVRFLTRVSPEAAKNFIKILLPKQKHWNICRKAMALPHPRSLSLLFSPKWAEKTGDKSRPFQGKIRTAAQISLLRCRILQYGKS